MPDIYGDEEVTPGRMLGVDTGFEWLGPGGPPITTRTWDLGVRGYGVGHLPEESPDIKFEGFENGRLVAVDKVGRKAVFTPKEGGKLQGRLALRPVETNVDGSVMLDPYAMQPDKIYYFKYEGETLGVVKNNDDSVDIYILDVDVSKGEPNVS